MATNNDFVMTYPCYFAFSPERGLQLNDVDGKQCLWLFTSERAVEMCYDSIHRRLHGRRGGSLRTELDKCFDSKGLLERLTLLIDDMAEDSIRHIVVDPLHGGPVNYTTILEFI